MNENELSNYAMNFINATDILKEMNINKKIEQKYKKLFDIDKKINNLKFGRSQATWGLREVFLKEKFGWKKLQVSGTS
jgi:hypothetical protein